MKIVILLAAGLLTQGCVSNALIPTPAQVAHKQEEIWVTESEIDLNLRSLKVIQERLVEMQATQANQGTRNYSVEVRVHDFDNTIQILRQARDRLAAQRESISEKYHYPKSTY